jgi:hypothetical protein
VLYEPGLRKETAAASRQEAAALLLPAVGEAYRSLIAAVMPAMAAA